MDSAQRHAELVDRTEEFALRIIRLYRALPKATEAEVLGKQALRSGTSIGANYCSAGRGRSRAEFSSKLGIVVEETAETVFWLRLLVRSGMVKPPRMEPLMREANELLRIFSASHGTARTRKRSGRSADQPITRSAD